MLLSCYRDVVIFNPQMNKPIGVHNLAVSASSFEVDFIVLLTIIQSPVFHFLLKTIRPRLIATSIIINPRLLVLGTGSSPIEMSSINQPR